MANNMNDMQAWVLNIFKSCTDTTVPYTIPFIISLQDMDLEI